MTLDMIIPLVAEILAFVHLLYSTMGTISLTLPSNFVLVLSQNSGSLIWDKSNKAEKGKINCTTEPWKLLKLKAPSDFEDGNVACEWKEKII